MTELNHHQWKLIFTSVRRYQKNMVGNPHYKKEYNELGEILNILQPIAYSETYLEHETINT